jgi:hypothetical protein
MRVKDGMHRCMTMSAECDDQEDKKGQWAMGVHTHEESRQGVGGSNSS